MPEFLPDLPRYVRKTPEGFWLGADHQNGPWRTIPAPQSGLPWRTDGPAAQSREPASVAPEANPSPADRMALALCRLIDPATGTCATGEICRRCRQDSAAVAHEIARQLRARYGSSTRADWLDGVGCHPESIRFDEGSTQRGNGHGGPTTPKPPAKPQPHGGRLIKSWEDPGPSVKPQFPPPRKIREDFL